MALDLVGITQAFFDRLASSSAGATARAALGSTSSVIPADKLKGYNTANPMPARVLCAFRAGETLGNAREGNQLRFSWWVYDDVLREYKQINTVIPLLISLYGENDIPSVFIRFNGASQEAPDPLYKMPVRRLTWTAFNRQ